MFGIRDVLSKQVQSLLENEIVEKSNYPWNASDLFITNASEKSEDFCKPNEKTIQDTFPIPFVNKILDQ